MARNDMTTRAFKEKIFATGFGEFVRTEPATGYNAPYVGYIKIGTGENMVPYDNKIVFEVLVSGDEISEEEYDRGKFS